MPISNIKCDWEDGDQVYKSDDGTEIARYSNSDSSFKITSLALEPKLDFIADTADIATDVTVAKINVIIADINAIKDVFVTAGLMAAS